MRPATTDKKRPHLQCKKEPQASPLAGASPGRRRLLVAALSLPLLLLVGGGVVLAVSGGVVLAVSGGGDLLDGGRGDL